MSKQKNTELFHDHFKSEIGEVEITATNKGITGIFFVDSAKAKANPNQHTQKCKEQLIEYFEKDRQEFDLECDPEGTEFQQQVWQALLTIPFGQVASYADIARKINNPKAVRAVGAANGKNPLTIIVPCHRVIGANGTLTGYASGLERKQWLLQHESKDMFKM
jgi:methylated-DNA-[protein]-cysteine S-methyltransferase